MFKLFIFTSILIFLVHGQRPKLTNLSSYAKLKTFDCYFNDFAVENWVFQNYSCELRPYTRSLKSMNVYLAMRKPLHKLFVRFLGIFYLILTKFLLIPQIHGQVYYQYDNLNFRKVLKVPQVEICYYIKFSSENFLLKLILEVLKKHLKALLDECPYEGVRNVIL